MREDVKAAEPVGSEYLVKNRLQPEEEAVHGLMISGSFPARASV